MKPDKLILLAGMPPEIVNEFLPQFNRRYRHIQIVAAPSLNRNLPYSTKYVECLYGKLVAALKKRMTNDSPINFELILIYLDKGDGGEGDLVKKFELETLILPLSVEPFIFDTKNQRNRAVNSLVKRAHKSISLASQLLSVIAEEITTRDNRTCLLLPQKNFGKSARYIPCEIRSGILKGDTYCQFKRRIDRVESQLDKMRRNSKWFFVGRNGITFRSPGTARHGMAPLPNSPDHPPACGVRGRFRFGAPYDPRFHYDCDIPRGGRVKSYHCHGNQRKPFGRSHVNIAPNDNVR